MNLRRFPQIAVLVLLLQIVGGRSAAAQAPEPLQVGVGYQLRHVSSDGSGVTFLPGFYADIGRGFKTDAHRAWSWMGQFDGSFRDDDGLNEQLYTVLGGIRLGMAKPRKWTPSAHGLIGFGSVNASCRDFCGGSNSGATFEGAFFVSTRVNPKTAATMGFKATKIKASSGGGLFNAVVAAGLRWDLSSR